MTQSFADRLIASREKLAADGALPLGQSKTEAEGGCGVIGMAASVPVKGRHLLQSLSQMRNRGNGKGGGIAAAGLDARFFGVDDQVLCDDYLVAVAYLDKDVRSRVENEFIIPDLIVDHRFEVPHLGDHRELAGLDVPPPFVTCYFVRPRPEAKERLLRALGGPAAPLDAVADEVLYQNTFRLNRACYASAGDKRAFVLSHGKNLLVLKMVGYGDDVVRYYQLQDLGAHLWIGHHRYPTKGKVWHPGGAHPFIGMHEALVHNGDFANYASMTGYLAQRNIVPLFLTDTEVAVQFFDLLHRVYGYPLEYVMEAMAPTTERDFVLLDAKKRDIYRALLATHIHGSPDGPWFFLLAQSVARERTVRLIGITDTSMLRPQVFALQTGEQSIGFAASEKQAIDAALASLSAEDKRFWPRADRYWNARGGSHTDGGAFVFTVKTAAGGAELSCTDKFGTSITPDPHKLPPGPAAVRASSLSASSPAGVLGATAAAVPEVYGQYTSALPLWQYGEVEAFFASLVATVKDRLSFERALSLLSLAADRRVSTGAKKPSGVLTFVDRALVELFALPLRQLTPGVVVLNSGLPPSATGEGSLLVIDARGFDVEGDRSLSAAIVAAVRRGFLHIVVAHAAGHRFIGCGLGPGTERVVVDVFGDSGDYLASGIDGALIVVHNSAQDQLAQIMKAGRLVVHGDVGQTFMYAAKGGEAFVLGNAAGRPLINAVGRPRVVINGTCLDYLAESFMAGDPLHGGGFVIVNGVQYDEDGILVDQITPYPGGNLFSLASGGCIYVRDPHSRVGEDQLNGGTFAALTDADWRQIGLSLKENERTLGVPVRRLLTVDGEARPPDRVYRKIVPASNKALAPEEAWVRKES